MAESARILGLCFLFWCAVLPPLAAEAQQPCNTDDLLAGAQPFTQAGTRGDVALLTDQRTPADGARWDVPEAVLLDGPQATLTYDLGAARSLSALAIQADANDTYQVSASLDGAHFERLIEIPNVVTTGHGLRQRVVHFTAQSLRYLRVGEARGDGFYSIAEFAAYCQAPTIAPPKPSTPAAVSGEAPASRIGPVLLLSALLLACLGLGAVTLAERRREAARLAQPADDSTSVDRRLHVMFLLSGCAALIYEIVWFHLLRLVIGASALSVGLVLASFMGGMFLGSLLFARMVPSARNPLRVYAALELGVGLFGLSMPLLLPLVRSLYLGLFGYGAASIALRATIAAALLLPPTALMGATLPAIARRYTPGRRAGTALSSLYAANTFGAVLGCLLTGFWLLASFDVWVATWTAAALNFAVATFALLTARGVAPAQASLPQPTAATSPRSSRQLALVHVAAGLSGLTALGAQVIWTRLLTLLFGATVYVFAIILAVFLAGLGLGGTFATFWLRRRGDAVRALLFSQLGLIGALALSGYLIADVLPYSAPSTLTPPLALHFLDMLRAVDVILPAACLWGMSFPFALAAASGEASDPARASGQLYAANTLGAIAGALATSFWLIPSFGTHNTERLLVVCATLSAALLVYAHGPGPSAPSAAKSAMRFMCVLQYGQFAAILLPGVPTQFLAHGRHIWSIDPRDIYPFVSEGATATVAVHIAPDGYKNFHVSGRVEASNNPDDLRLERLLGHLSALAHPQPRSVLVVGLGGGVTAGALSLHPEVKRIVICEIEPRVTGATQQFAHENYAILSDPRVQLVFDDARHFLATTHEHFDVITSDPIHPWVRGNSVLFSQQYYAIVREHLREGGIATQWVPLYDTNDEAIRIQMRTFSAAFPDASVWNSSIRGGGYDVVLLGRAKRAPWSLPAIQQRIDANPRLAASLREVRIDSAIDLLATYGASARDMRRFIGDAPINDDFSLKLEYISGLALNQQRADPIYQSMVANAAVPSDLFEGAGSAALLQRLAHPR